MCLGVKHLTPHHTGANIKEDLQEMLGLWGIHLCNVVSGTTDNGANIVAAIKLLFNNDAIHVPCLAHNINLVVTKALGAVEDIIKIIEKVKNIVAYFKHSNNAQDDLRAEQRKEGKTEGTFQYLKQEIATRWNSTFYCLESFLTLSSHVCKILLLPKHKKGPPMLTAEELELVAECIQILKPFEVATKDISGEKYISGSLVIPLTNCLRTSLEKINLTSLISNRLKVELEKQIEKRLSPMEKNALLASATILDPRFKKIHFQSPVNVANVITRLKQEMWRELKQDFDPEQTIGKSVKPKGLENIWQVHEEVASISNKSISELSGNFPTEFKLYLDQPLLPRESDPIKYWIENKNAFPGTSKLALKYLTTLGASVPSERVVSLLNNICTDRRIRLTSDHTNELVFLGSLDNSFWNI